MSPEPIVQPLPYNHRLWFFRGLLFLFVCAVPVFMFYATGYRISFTETSNIISVGGIFISAETEETAIYLNNELVENYRLFQRAAYIQNLPAGVHRLHVQGEGLHTWVKELPVYPHIVTEAAAFNYPVTPQVRLITPLVTSTDLPYVPVASGTPLVLAEVVYQTPVLASTTVATSTLTNNEEYLFITEVFASSSTTTSPDTVRTQLPTQIAESFTFSSERATSTATTSLTQATTTRERNNRTLYETAEGVTVRWDGDQQKHPYYFCLNTSLPTASSSPLEAVVAGNVASVADSLQTATVRGNFVCRDTIPLTTFGRPVLLFDFMPNTSDIALLQLSDGLYAVEFDDRGWQNTQLLYPGEEINVAVVNEQIFIADNGYYVELLLELAQ
jgi:hypothetical protein